MTPSLPFFTSSVGYFICAIVVLTMMAAMFSPSRREALQGKPAAPEPEHPPAPAAARKYTEIPPTRCGLQSARGRLCELPHAHLGACRGTQWVITVDHEHRSAQAQVVRWAGEGGSETILTEEGGS